MKMCRAILFVLITIVTIRTCDAEDKLNVIRGHAPKENSGPPTNRRELGVELEDAVRKITGSSERVAIHSIGRVGLRVVVVGKLGKDQASKVIEAVRKRVLDSDAEYMHLIFMKDGSDAEIRERIADTEKGGDLSLSVYLSLREKLTQPEERVPDRDTPKESAGSEAEKNKVRSGPDKDRHNP